MGNTVGQGLSEMASAEMKEALPEWARRHLDTLETQSSEKDMVITLYASLLDAGTKTINEQSAAFDKVDKEHEGLSEENLKLKAREATLKEQAEVVKKQMAMVQEINEEIVGLKDRDSARYRLLLEKKHKDNGKMLKEIYDSIEERDKLLGDGKHIVEGMDARIKELEEKVKELQKFKNEATRLKTRAKEARAKAESKDDILKNKEIELKELQGKYAALEISHSNVLKDATLLREQLTNHQRSNKQQKSRKNQWTEVQGKFAEEIEAKFERYVIPVQQQVDTANAALEVSRKNAAYGAERLMVAKATIESKENEMESMLKAHSEEMAFKDNQLTLYKHVVDALWPIRARHNFKYFSERTPRMMSLKTQGSKIAHEGNLEVDTALCVLGYFTIFEVSILEKDVYRLELGPFLGTFKTWQTLFKPSMQLTRELARIKGTLFGCGESCDGAGGLQERMDKLVKELNQRLKGIKDVAKADEVRVAYYEMLDVQSELRIFSYVADEARRQEWMNILGKADTERDR